MAQLLGATVRRSSAVLFARLLPFVGFKEGGWLACGARAGFTSEEAERLQKKEETEKLGGAQRATTRASSWAVGGSVSTAAWLYGRKRAPTAMVGWHPVSLGNRQGGATEPTGCRD